MIEISSVDHPKSDARSVGTQDRRQALALLWQAARPDRGQFIKAVLGLVLAGILEAAGPLLGKHLIDVWLIPRKLDLAAMAWLLGGVLATGCVATAVRYFEMVRLDRVSMNAVERLRTRVLKHVLSLPMHFFDVAHTGQLVSRITDDTEAVKQLYTPVVFELLYGLTVLLGVVLAMLWLDWRLMLILLLLVPATVVIVWGYQRLSAAAVMHARQLRSELHAQLNETIAGIRVLQAMRVTRRFAVRFNGMNEAQYRARLGEVRANAWLLRPALDFLSVILIVGVVAVAGSHWFGAIEIGLLYAFISYVARVVEPLIQITMQFSMVQQSVVAAVRVDRLLRTPKGHSTSGPIKNISSGSVQISHVTFGYEPQTPVLHDISLDFEAGGFYGIVGHTGSGKSTLLSLLLRFYAPQSGQVNIDGVVLAELNEPQFRRDVGLVPQEPFLWATSPRDNIDMGRGLTDEEIKAAARTAGAHVFIERLPNGYDTDLGEGGALLSSGQKQLIAVARVLAGKPRILLLDEATSRIDSETEQHVHQALEALRGHVTVIAIAHRLSTVRSADRIVVLSHGRVVEQGVHADLMAREGGIYQRLYHLQQISD